MTTLTHLECSLCGKTFQPGQPAGLCDCGAPLVARYDLENVRRGWSREWLGNAQASMWRYTPLLPVTNPACIVSLGEGLTPLVRTRRQVAKDLWIKDEGLNPTGSVKARGLACAVSMAVEMAIGKVSIAAAGHAAEAMTAYAAAAGIEAGIGGGGLDLTAWHEPYRLEGNKTLGFEIAEQLRWELPGAILCPTGSGMALVGMWKAFEEMEAVGWISGQRPKMIAVQAEGCRPVVEALRLGEAHCRRWPDAFTLAGGLGDPQPLGGALILKVLRASGGTAVAVSDAQMLDAGLELARTEGVFASPEGAACVAALPGLLEAGLVDPAERIVIVSSGSGLKYPEAYATRSPRSVTEQDKLGGLITPR